MRVRLTLCGVLMVCLCFASTESAKEAVKVDPQHYSVVSENNEVRILKVHYGPHEKSVMHSDADTVAVFLNGSRGQFVDPDGKTEEILIKGGDPEYEPQT